MAKANSEAAIGTNNSAEAYQRTVIWLNDVEEPNFNAPLVDKSKAVSAFIDLQKMIKEPEIERVFARLPAELFDPKILERFPDLSLSIWYLGNQISALQAMESRTKVPSAILEDAKTLRTQLLDLARYHLGDLPAVAQLLSEIKKNVGYMDLAKDLEQLAGLIEAHRSKVESDQRNYSPNCTAEARRLAQEVLKSLTSSDNEKRRTNLLYNKMWNIACFYFNEIYVTGKWAFRGTATADRFQTLTAMTRKRKGKTSGTSTEATATSASETSAEDSE